VRNTTALRKKNEANTRLETAPGVGRAPGGWGRNLSDTLYGGAAGGRVNGWIGHGVVTKNHPKKKGPFCISGHLVARNEGVRVGAKDSHGGSLKEKHAETTKILKRRTGDPKIKTEGGGEVKGRRELAVSGGGFLG